MSVFESWNKVFFEEKPNIIHVRSRVPSWTAGKVAKKMNIPLVSTIHGSYVANSIFKRFYNSASIKADKIIAISNYIKDNILKNNLKHTLQVQEQSHINAPYL